MVFVFVVGICRNCCVMLFSVCVGRVCWCVCWMWLLVMVVMYWKCWVRVSNVLSILCCVILVV